MSKDNKLRKVFSPPVFPDDEEKDRLAYYINTIVLVSLAALMVLILLRIKEGVGLYDISNVILVAVSAILMIVWLIMKSGAVRLAGYITIGAVWMTSTLLALSGSGLRGVGFVSYFIVVLLAGLLLGTRAAAGTAFLSTISGFGFAYAEAAGIFPLSFDPPFVVASEFAFLFFISTVLIRLTINSLRDALSAAKNNAKELAASNEELTLLRDALEVRIQERTASLEKRASQLQIVSSVARNITSITDIDNLLPNTTKLVSEQFGFYHTGIFLLDEANEYAILKAANSEGGRQMLTRGHRLSLDSNSIVGYAASHGEPRIALDVGADSVYFNNPDLPDTCSEMALPLRIGGRVIGILDVQSRDKNAFSEEDIFVLSTLADQIAIAIENARLHDETQKALAESRSTFEKYVRQEWSMFAQQVRNIGYVFDGKQIVPLDKKVKSGNVQPFQLSEKPLAENLSTTMTLPIKLRGQTIGVLAVRSKKGEREWTRSEINLLEAAADRAGLALENARLVESAQRRASRERSIGEISAKIGAVSDINSILQTAVEELGRKLSGATDVTFELDPDQMKHG